MSSCEGNTNTPQIANPQCANPLWAPHFADRATSCVAEIVENVCIAENTYRVRINCPEVAKRITPGQFVMLKLAGCNDPILGRPLALYDVIQDSDGSPTHIDVVYFVIGKMTSRLAQQPAGGQIEIWGPLGNGFSLSGVKTLIMVAGGIGQTPFLALGKSALGKQSFGDTPGEHVENAILCYGARSKEYLAGVEDFKNAGIDLRISTDDGSEGHHGLVTDLLEDALKERAEANALDSTLVVCCGPEPMMEAVSKIANRTNVRCQVSLETPMACGIGICFSCVAKVIQEDGEWDYKRTCVEGPVFDACKIVWD